MIKRAVSNFRLYYRLRKELLANRGRVCLVHQMGKVGSSSVYYSLKDSLEMPVYHTHFLSLQGIENAERFFRNADAPVPYNVRFSRVLRRLLPDMRPIIITLVRDPIAREISNYFQIGDRVFPALQAQKNGQLSGDGEAIVHEVSAQIRKLRDTNHHIHMWFENEIQSVFGIDVYSTPFDFERGFVVIPDAKAKVLLFRLEDLDHSFEDGMRQVFGNSANFKLAQRNRSKDKKYADLWRFVTQRIRVAPEVCEEIYRTRLGRHFFQDMAERLTRKWSGVDV